MLRVDAGGGSTAEPAAQLLPLRACIAADIAAGQSGSASLQAPLGRGARKATETAAATTVTFTSVSGSRQLLYE